MSGLQDLPPEGQIEWLTNALHHLSMTGHAREKRLELLLLQFGRHADGCGRIEWLTDSPTIAGCSCGWRQAVAEIWPRT